MLFNGSTDVDFNSVATTDVAQNGSSAWTQPPIPGSNALVLVSKVLCAVRGEHLRDHLR